MSCGDFQPPLHLAELVPVLIDLVKVEIAVVRDVILHADARRPGRFLFLRVHQTLLRRRPLMRVRAVKRSLRRRREPRVSDDHARDVLSTHLRPSAVAFRLCSHELAQIRALHVHHATSRAAQRHSRTLPSRLLTALVERHDSTALRPSHHRHVHHLLQQIERPPPALALAPRRVDQDDSKIPTQHRPSRARQRVQHVRAHRVQDRRPARDAQARARRAFIASRPSRRRARQRQARERARPAHDRARASARVVVERVRERAAPSERARERRGERRRRRRERVARVERAGASARARERERGVREDVRELVRDAGEGVAQDGAAQVERHRSSARARDARRAAARRFGRETPGSGATEATQNATASAREVG